jgi:tRNA pseudouridine55 synthase
VTSPEGLLLVDKPGGVTSHDVVDVVRRKLGTRKVGHAGTLDPLATGLLLVGVGRATRLLRYLSGLPKTYEGSARLGVETDTLDAEGAVTRTAPVDVSRAELESAMRALVGDIE